MEKKNKRLVILNPEQPKQYSILEYSLCLHKLNGILTLGGQYCNLL